MKTLLISLLTLFVFASCVPAVKAQNYVGCSKKAIYDNLHDKGYVVHEYAETETMNNCYFVSDNGVSKMYIFNSNNLCVKYVCWFKENTFSEMEGSLLSNDYVKHADNYYYKDDYVAKIEYSTKDETWSFTIVLNNK